MVFIRFRLDSGSVEKASGDLLARFDKDGDEEEEEEEAKKGNLFEVISWLDLSESVLVVDWKAEVKAILDNGIGSLRLKLSGQLMLEEKRRKWCATKEGGGRSVFKGWWGWW